jgi:branched-chain amino acid transport system substrate-binding protein
MSDEIRGPEESKEESSIFEGRPVNRREFVKLAGVAGATVGLGAGLGGLLAACGGTTTTSTAATTATTAGSTTTSVAASTTTVSAGPEQGREIKIGDVSPVTGALAVFGATEDWSVKLGLKTLGDGIVLGDGKLHKISILVRDSQSDTNRSAQVAGDLITNDNVDMMIASGTPDNVNPAADQCEALGCPFVSNFNIWQAFTIGRGGTPTTEYKWVFGFLFGPEQNVVCDNMVLSKMGTNKKVGFMYPNDADGNTLVQIIPPGYEKLGYTNIITPPYQNGTEDFTSEITTFKKEGIEIVCTSPIPPDLITFWHQCLQQGFHPKALLTGKAYVNMSVPISLGPGNVGTLGACAWHRYLPFKDELTGMTGVEIADDYETATGQQWAQTIGCHAKLTWAINVLKRATNLDDKQTIVDAIKTTKMELLTGPIDMTVPVDINGPHVTPNVYKQGWCDVQIVNGADAKPTPSKWPEDQNIVGVDNYPSSVQPVDPIAQTYA